MQASSPAVRLLVVEDEGLVAADLESRLERMGYEVCAVADNAEDAVRLARQLLPDLVLMDIHLIGSGDGISAADSIRLSPGTPVVFATAHADDATVLRAKHSEPYGYVIKPYENRDLRVGIEMALTRHRADVRARKMEQWVASTLSSLGDGVIATEPDGRIRFLNDLAARLTGWSSLEAFGRPLEEVFRLRHAATHAVLSVPDLLAQAGREGIQLFLDEHLLLRRDDCVLGIDESIAPIRGQTGQIEGAVIVLRDATARKHEEAARLGLELRLQEELRLEGIGFLAGGIAQDFQNLLSVVQGNIALAKEGVLRTSPVQSFLAAAQSAAVGAGELCQGLLTYSGRAVRSLGNVDLSGIAQDCLLLARRRAPKGVELQATLGERLPRLVADAGQIQQIIMNLLFNAFEAMPPRGGTVRLSTGSVRAIAAELDACLIGSDCTPGTYLFLEVADDGPGMPPELLGRIFDPFFTTKPNARGLGLAALTGIVRQQHGAVRVETEIGRGTTLRVLLPAV